MTSTSENPDHLLDQYDAVIEAATAAVTNRRLPEAVCIIDKHVAHLEGSHPTGDTVSIIAKLHGQGANFEVAAGRYQDAIDRLEKAVNKYPGNNRLKLDLVRIAILDGNWTDDQVLGQLRTLIPPLEGVIEIPSFRRTVTHLESSGVPVEVLDNLRKQVLLG